MPSMVVNRDEVVVPYATFLERLERRRRIASALREAEGVEVTTPRGDIDVHSNGGPVDEVLGRKAIAAEKRDGYDV